MTVNNNAAVLDSVRQWLDAKNGRQETEQAANDAPASPAPSKTKTGIQAKMRVGKRLSESERQYLRLREPEEYAKVAKLEREQLNYKKLLRGCRGPSARQDVKFSKTMNVLAEAKMGAKTSGADPEYTLMRLRYLQQAEREARFSRWA